jgi:hypothetical protein
MATAGATQSRLLELEGNGFAEHFGGDPMAVRHSLNGHPLLELDAIAELADSMPLRAVERHEAEQPMVQPGGAPELGGRPSETVLGIENNGCWMVLWNIEQSPRYRALLDAVLDEAQGHLPRREGAMRRREAFLFLSAPDAVTPVHFDPEHNFLLQIQGQKDMNVGRFADPADHQRELDRYHDGGHRNLDRMPEQFETFSMHPGDGVYVWPWAPHWVKNGPAASISLSITFRTKHSHRAERVHRFNARLRRMNRSPRPPGSSAATDRVKSALLGAGEGARRLLRSGPHISR